ncbi:MAG: LPS export ABC transporter periplasmic protein LptC [Rhodospirillaceae bacterium]|nr:LPS export ABC transporter periplasmic protein LptC [Rhodospirillaceae bacterium]
MTTRQTELPVSPNAETLVGERPSGISPSYRLRELRNESAGHSRFVKMMKIALPLIAILLIALIIAWPYFGDNQDGFKIEFSSLKVAPGEHAGVDNARYFGVDDLNRPYTISADLARFLDGPKGPISLEVPKADITMNDDTWLVMTSTQGKYDQQKKLLSLSGKVNLFHDMGYEMITDEIDINLAKNDAIGTKPVKGHGPFGELDASGVRIDKNNNTIFFIGKSRLLLFPSSGKDIYGGGNK